MIGSIQNGVKVVGRLVTAENQRTDSLANRYLIAPEFLLQVEKELRGTGTEMVGFFHSHPDVPARPSNYDREHAWPWYSYVITSVEKGMATEVLSWELKEDRSTFHAEQLEVIIK